MLDQPKVVDLTVKSWGGYLGAEPSHMPPIAVNARDIHRRIRAQKGRFTLHGSITSPLHGFHPLQSFLRSFVIPARSVRGLAAELAKAGYIQETLFPELDHVARRIRDAERVRFEAWRQDWRQGNVEEDGS